MLYISEDDEVVLPKEFHKSNNLCAILYDQIAECFSYAEYLNTNIEFDRDTHKLIDEFRNGEINALEWLQANEFDDELSEVVAKHLVLAILSDFVNFTYESISCAQRGKTTVAYSLLRKPFTDELLMLEQLHYDFKEFVDRFYHSGNPDDYDPSSRSIDKKQIIKNAISNIDTNYIFTEDMLYDLRYNKEMKAGINGISNQAIHIVTKDRNYKTQNQGLNFVFFKEEDVQVHWKHFYYFVPYLLLYSACLVDGIIFNFLKDENTHKARDIKKFRRFLGMLFWSEWSSDGKSETSKEMFKFMSETIKLDCEKCDEEIDLVKADFELFFETEFFLCPSCFENLMLVESNISTIQEFMREL